MYRNPHTLLSVGITLCLLTTLSTCATPPQRKLLYTCTDDLCEEFLHPDSSAITDYTEDNLIYTEGREFIYDYYYAVEGHHYLIGEGGHTLVSPDSADDQTIQQVSFVVDRKQGQMMRDMIPDYRQSGINYHYYTADGTSLQPREGSGLIENEVNVWLHPFRRSTYFAMLNINPYPYVRLPLRVGDQYHWQLGLGGPTYTNPIWAVWEGPTVRKHTYRVVSKQVTDYPFADAVETYTIEAIATSEIGPSAATFIFSETYGFVELHYANLNNSRFVFKLARIIFSQ